MQDIVLSSGWSLDFQDGVFVVRGDNGNTELFIETPIELDSSVENLKVEVYEYAISELTESSIFPIYVKIGDNPRVGMMIPANALSSVEHDLAKKQYFKQYSFMTIRSVLQKLCDESPETFQRYAEFDNKILFSDLYDDNISFCVISNSESDEIEGFSYERIEPSLIVYGYVPKNKCIPSELTWRSKIPLSPGKLNVSMVSDDLEDISLIVDLLVLVATSNTSVLTQFFYLYQIFEYLMDCVMRHRLSSVAQQMIDNLGNKAISARDQFESLSDEVREKGRLKLLVTNYSSCERDLAALEQAAKEFLDLVGAKSSNGIDAVYKVRNYLFHQARNLPQHHPPVLGSVVEAFTDFLPALLKTYNQPKIIS